MVKWLSAASFSALLWFASFVIIRGLETDLITLAGLSVFALVPVTVGILTGCIDRFVTKRNSWSPQILDLNPGRPRPMDIDQLQRRSACLLFAAWKPGADVTIH